MTPKEKANELMDSMLGYGDEYHHCTQYVAKQCALIAIEEIKETLREVCDEEILGIHMVYWSKVKQEIEKL